MMLRPVGYVASPVKRRHDMPPGGVAASIRILPRYGAALKGISNCSHLWILCCFDRADRSVLKAAPRKISASLGKRGVFAMRSPDRPNPVSLTCAGLVSVKGRLLELDALDAVDGTPVADIKPYSPGTDCVPSAARPDFSERYRLAPDEYVAASLARTVRNFCGPGAEGMKAAALAFKYCRLTGVAPESGAERLATGLRGGGIDALHALFAIPPSRAITRGNYKSPAIMVTLHGRRVKIRLEPGDLRRFMALAATAGRFG
ncbi:MAG: tRNA (N6-threonylcarbamoyladenosine(37)-N6)-methyltransferase TrmO [Elusimicrobiales bacterium]